MKGFWQRKPVMIVNFYLALMFIFAAFVMVLWNLILPEVIGVKSVNYFQALGILILSKILFSGFFGKHGWPGQQWKQEMKEKFSNMTPEEKEKFKTEWKNRCGGRWGMHTDTKSSGVAPE